MLRKIRSKYLIKEVIEYLNISHKMKLVKYSKQFQFILNLSKSDYKEYSQIIIELILETDNDFLSEKNIFINYISENNKHFYHIFFNNNLQKEIYQNYYDKDEKIEKIKIYIDNNITSLKNLFVGCKTIQEVNFINFNRKNINNMSGMFQECKNLKKITFNKFNTINVKEMNYMFYQCFQLEDLNLSNFDTKNVVDMKKMFFECRKLKKIIFGPKFSIIKIKNMNYFFHNCFSLIDLDISNLIFNRNTDINLMFNGCSKKLISKIKNDIKNVTN